MLTLGRPALRTGPGCGGVRGRPEQAAPRPTPGSQGAEEQECWDWPLGLKLCEPLISWGTGASLRLCSQHRNPTMDLEPEPASWSHWEGKLAGTFGKSVQAHWAGEQVGLATRAGAAPGPRSRWRTWVEG